MSSLFSVDQRVCLTDDKSKVFYVTSVFVSDCGEFYHYGLVSVDGKPSIFPEWHLSPTWGGRRICSNNGRPKGSNAWGETTTPLRVPASIAPHIHSLVALPADLVAFISDIESRYKPDSVRAEVAFKIAEDLRSYLVDFFP